MFVDRLQELDFLNQLLTRTRPGPAQMVLLYGRRRVGKTALLNHWIQQANVPYTYWVSGKEAATLQRRDLFATLLKMPHEQATTFDSWSTLWHWLAPRLASETRREILILDELSYATEADASILSALQHSWDQHLQGSNLTLVLCGSQVRTMEGLLRHQSPLFGRFTGQWHLQPLPFYALKEFVPQWSIEERIALYAIVGGIPAYLEWLDPNLSLAENIRDVILAPGSMFMAEPMLLLYDEVQSPQSYLTILQSIGNGRHTLSEISKETLINRTSLPSFLKKLQELRFVERRLPATLTTAQQRTSKRGRYHLADAYLRFYFRFLAPYQRSFMRPHETLVHLQNELRAFVGIHFETIAQEWVAQQARNNQLPFMPEAIGSHWSRHVQVDVVAVDWRNRNILIGECKWGAQPVGRQVAMDLIEGKAPRLQAELPQAGKGWTFYYALFARAGFTEGARSEMLKQDVLLVDLALLEQGLAE